MILALPRGTRDLYQVLAWCLFGVSALGEIVLSGGCWGRATRFLVNLDDARFVGPLLDVLTAHFRDGGFRSTIRGSLLRLLPRLKASDAARLLPRHIAALNQEAASYGTRQRETDEEVAYALVVFQALEQVGDETSVPVVEQIVQTTRNVQIREAAESCLPFLRERAALGKNTLLRSANSPVSNLLLPANGGEISEATVLLRPHSGENR